MRFNFTMGVSPTVLRMFSWIFMRRESTDVREEDLNRNDATAQR
jgi:hypothetical protein